MSNQTREVFAIALAYTREAYKILEISEPPALTLCAYAICSGSRPTVTQIANSTGLTLKTTSRCLKYMRSEMGTIELSTDTVDTRMRRVTLTKKGHDVERALYQNILKCVKAVAAANHPRLL